MLFENKSLVIERDCVRAHSVSDDRKVFFTIKSVVNDSMKAIFFTIKRNGMAFLAHKSGQNIFSFRIRSNFTKNSVIARFYRHDGSHDGEGATTKGASTTTERRTTSANADDIASSHLETLRVERHADRCGDASAAAASNTRDWQGRGDEQ